MAGHLIHITITTGEKFLPDAHRRYPHVENARLKYAEEALVPPDGIRPDNGLNNFLPLRLKEISEGHPFRRRSAIHFRESQAELLFQKDPVLLLGRVRCRKPHTEGQQYHNDDEDARTHRDLTLPWL